MFTPRLEEKTPSPFVGIVGEDPALLAVLAKAARVAPTRTPVLVTGESGTGKELIARLLHERGPEPSGPFVAVNCGALARELAESELFGHERGAFTGAGARRTGWFEEASGGTLVLDEIGELPLDLQPKLLRVLETGRLRRVGGSGEVTVRVRIVAMTLRDLRSEVARKRFRIDLYHRLSGFELPLPPLRERPGDVLLLATHFLRELTARHGRRELGPSAIAALRAYCWPGNVRELRNAIERAMISSDDVIDAAALGIDGGGWEQRFVDRAAEDDAPALPAMRLADAEHADPAAGRKDVLSLLGKTYAELQMEIFRWALARNGGSRRRAARALGISRSTFCERVKRLGVA